MPPCAPPQRRHSPAKVLRVALWLLPPRRSALYYSVTRLLFSHIHAHLFSDMRPFCQELKKKNTLYLVWPVGPDAIRREGQIKWVETTRLHSLHNTMHCGRFDQPLAVCTGSVWDLLISGKAISRKPNDIVYLFV